MKEFTIIIIIIAVLNIVQLFIDRDHYPKGKKEICVVVINVFLFLFAGIIQIETLELDVPEYRVNADQTGIQLISKQAYANIEYRLQENDVEVSSWTIYKGENIEITHDPTKIEFRNSFLWKHSKSVEKICRINEYDQVWVDIPPDIPITSIYASYNVREPSINRSGNTYVGYSPTKSDFTVKGVDSKDNKDISISKFTFSPTKLKQGENKITIEYVTDSGQKHYCDVSVFADDPELVALNASFVGDNPVTVGSVLTTDCFNVTGIYENGEKKQLDNFKIDPCNMEEEGEYTVKISVGKIETEINITVIDPKHIPEPEKGPDSIPESEKESNDSIEKANNILENAQYTGKLSKEEDVDYYRLNIREKGNIRIEFSHNKIDSDDYFWKVSLLDAEQNDPIIKMWVKGSISESSSNLARIKPGVYYIKVERDYYSDIDYTFSAVYNEEDLFFETEQNDEPYKATQIEVNSDSPYTGNLMSDYDKDYYVFNIPQKGKVGVIFSHPKTDDSDFFWQVSVLSDVDDTVFTSIRSRGNEPSKSSDYVRLPAGKYYIRVDHDYWSDIDYQLSVNYIAENDNSETEPNNDIAVATKVDLNQSITGNLQSDEDVDFYEIDLNNEKDLHLEFSHQKTDKDDPFWCIELHGDSSDPIANADDDKTVRVYGNDADIINIQWNSLKSGKYYVKIYDYYYCNDDYNIVVY